VYGSISTRLASLATLAARWVLAEIGRVNASGTDFF
jgi:hypothetical protein